MKCLIVEDDFTARRLLQMYLSEHGECFVAADGCEAVEAVKEALEQNEPYDLICLDILMPRMDGRDALQAIRRLEHENGIPDSHRTKVIMTSALGDPESITKAFKKGCEAYIVKPVQKVRLIKEMERLGFLQFEASK